MAQTILLPSIPSLSLALYLVNDAGSVVGDAAGYDFVEYATGLYRASIPDNISGERIGVRVDLDGATMTSGYTHIPGEAGAVVVLGDIDEATITTIVKNGIRSAFGTVKIINAVSQDGGNIRVIQGDDYLAVDDRSLIWTGETEDVWGDLTGASIAFGAQYGDFTIQRAGSVLVATGLQQIQVELLAADTLTMPIGDTYAFDVSAKLNGESVITLLRGRMQVLRSYSDPAA